jgi:hypothetical protein
MNENYIMYKYIKYLSSNDNEMKRYNVFMYSCIMYISSNDLMR